MCSITFLPAELLQVACTLFYSDVNVTQLEPGRVIKVCKGSWTEIQDFNAVAWESGSGRNGIDLPEAQQVRRNERHELCLKLKHLVWWGAVVTVVTQCFGTAINHSIMQLLLCASGSPASLC